MSVTASELIIETRSLTKRYGKVTAVDSLSLKVPRGGVFGLLGPNGSGKTTTISMMLGLVRPTAGSVRLIGHETSTGQPDLNDLRRIGAIVETPALYPYMTGRQNLRYFQGLGKGGTVAEIDRLLDLVGLTARANTKMQTYSLGMKQRLGIACALLGDPELVFLDEPTNGLDPAGMAEMRGLVRKLGHDRRTVVLSSHLLKEVEEVCDQIAILSKGRLIAQGRVQDLLQEQTTVKLKTTNDAEATSILTALPWVEAIRSDGGYIVAVVPPQRSWELAAALAASQIFVSELTPVHVSLEQYFLEVTADVRPAASQEVR